MHSLFRLPKVSCQNSVTKILQLTLLLLFIGGCGQQESTKNPQSSSPNGAKETLDKPVAKKPQVRIRNKSDKQPEPTVDMNLPVGTPTPPFAGSLSPDASVKNRTGTYGGRLVYAILGEVETFNPVEPKGATDQEIRALAFSSLVSYNNGKWEAEPELAKSWEISDDLLTWTFFMRDGIRWSDGEVCDVEDALFSFQAIFHPKIATSIKDGFKHPITGTLPKVSADKDRNALVFKLDRIDSQFLTHVGNASIIPEHKWNTHLQAEDPTLLQQMTSNGDPADLIGCGPFILKQYIPAEKIVYERNPYYWKVDARQQRLPYLDQVVIVLVKDVNLHWQKFEAGELDIFMDLPADHFKEALAMEKSNAADLVRLGVSLNSNWVCFNLHPGKDADSGEPFVDPAKSYWFNNLKFRQAVNHAIDRDGIKRTAFQGRATPIWSSITPGNISWYHNGVQKYPHSLEKAGALLDDLGWIDTDGDGIREDDKGRKISFSLNTNVENNLRQQVGNLLSKNLISAGLDVNFKPIIFNDLVTSLRDSHKWDMILLGWGSGVPPDPANGKNITLSSGRLHAWYPQQPEPATEWEARVDELMAMMDEELDNKVRKKYYDEVQELIGQNIPMIYLIAANSYAAVQKDRLGNLWPSLLRPMLTWNIETIWKKSP